MDLGLTGKRAIITGASRGIGRAIADLLVGEGASVAICARGAEGVKQAVDGWQARGAQAYGEALDVTDQAALGSWYANAVAALGGLDILISNVSTRIQSQGETRWQETFDVDFMQHVRTAELAVEALSEGGGSVVFVSSIASAMADIIPMEREYGVMKSALNTYATQLAQRLAKAGVRSNVVCPGPIDFPGGFWDQVNKAFPDLYKGAARLAAMRRHGTAEEVANAVVFLASPAASYITGANLRIDGGALKHVV